MPTRAPLGTTATAATAATAASAFGWCLEVSYLTLPRWRRGMIRTLCLRAIARALQLLRHKVRICVQVYSSPSATALDQTQLSKTAANNIRQHASSMAAVWRVLGEFAEHVRTHCSELKRRCARPNSSSASKASVRKGITSTTNQVSVQMPYAN